MNLVRKSNFAVIQPVHRTAIRTLAVAFRRDVNVDLGVGLPNHHACFGAWAEDTAVVV